METKEKATIIEALPSIRFKIELDSGREMMAYLSGKMNKNFIRILVGDKVEVVVPETGNISRIVRRLNG